MVEIEVGSKQDLGKPTVLDFTLTEVPAGRSSPTGNHPLLICLTIFFLGLAII